MIESLKELLGRHPFHPFQVVLTSGDRYPIADPGLAVLMESQMFIAEARSDRFHLLRLNQIAAVESLPTAA